MLKCHNLELSQVIFPARTAFELNVPHGQTIHPLCPKAIKLFSTFSKFCFVQVMNKCDLMRGLEPQTFGSRFREQVREIFGLAIKFVTFKSVFETKYIKGAI